MGISLGQFFWRLHEYAAVMTGDWTFDPTWWALASQLSPAYRFMAWGAVLTGLCLVSAILVKSVSRDDGQRTWSSVTTIGKVTMLILIVAILFKIWRDGAIVCDMIGKQNSREEKFCLWFMYMKDSCKELQWTIIIGFVLLTISTSMPDKNEAPNNRHEATSDPRRQTE